MYKIEDLNIGDVVEVKHSCLGLPIFIGEIVDIKINSRYQLIILISRYIKPINGIGNLGSFNKNIEDFYNTYNRSLPNNLPIYKLLQHNTILISINEVTKITSEKW